MIKISQTLFFDNNYDKILSKEVDNMSKKKSKSYVQMKEKKSKNEEYDILNPLKEYEYIEPKKKFPIKQILLIFFIIIIIILIIIFFALIDKKTTETNSNTTSNDNNITTNSTTTTTTTTIDKNQNEEITTETLTCHTITTEENIEIKVQVTANFYENQLKSDINYMILTLKNEDSRTLFDNYVLTLQMFAIYLSDDEAYEVSESTTDNEFILEIKTTYSEDKTIEGNLSYNESYESVKQKLLDLGHTCE